MVLGPAHPIWSKLYVALANLATGIGGTAAFVLDEGNGLWCVGIADSSPTTITHDQNEAADRFYAREVAPRVNEMRRGVRLQIVRTEGDDRYVGLSFASIYVVVVLFDHPYDPFNVVAKVREALPEIERLTLALPGSGPPGSDAGAAKARA